MPGLDGIEATRRLPRHKVLVLTTFGLDEYIVEALRAGASGFLTKDVPRQELVAAVKAVANGDAVLGPKVTRQLLDRVAHRLPQTTPNATLAELTDREREVLNLIAGGLSNQEIARALVVAEPTAKRHVSNLLGKLGLRDRVQAVIYAYEHGVIRTRSGRVTWLSPHVTRLPQTASRRCFPRTAPQRHPADDATPCNCYGVVVDSVNVSVFE